MNMAVGIIIGVFLGFLVRPALDAYVMWRAQEEYRDAPLVDVSDLDSVALDIEPRS